MKFLFLLLLTGCTSTWVKKVYEPKSGVIRYLNEGAGFVIDARRKQATQEMEKFCSPERPKLLSESLNEKTQGALVTGGPAGLSAFNIESGYIYLSFRCE